LITLTQNSVNTFVLNPNTRAEDGEYYIFEMQSTVTKDRIRVFPIVVTATDRAVTFQLTLVALLEDVEPLIGTQHMSPSGSWNFKCYVTNELSLAPTTLVLVQSGLVKLIEACAEVPAYVYVSDNEDMSASVFLSRDVTDECLTFSASTYFQLGDQLFNCTPVC
jgi:hypothetical protein